MASGERRKFAALVFGVLAAIVVLGWLLFAPGEREAAPVAEGPKTGESAAQPVEAEAAAAPMETVSLESTPAPSPAGGHVLAFAYNGFTGAGVADCLFAVEGVGEARSGPDGMARIDAPAGDYEVRVRPPAGWANVDGGVLPATVTNDGPALVAVKLYEGIAIRGQVFDERGAAVAGAEVRLRAEDASIGDRTVSGADGSFTVALPMACEDVRLWARDAGRISGVEGPMTVTEAVEGVVLTLGDGAPGAIEGAVVDETGVGLAGIVVLGSLRHDWLTVAFNATTEKDGTFRAGNLPPGTYLVMLRGVNAETSAEVVAGETTGGVRLTLELPKGLSIRGVVRTADGRPVSGATISASGGQRASTSSQADGAFAVMGLQEGRVVLTARHRDYFLPEQGIRVDAGAVDVAIVMEPVGAIAGQVVDKRTGKPIPVFQAMTERPGMERGMNPSEFRTFHDPEGRFTLSGLKPEGVSVFVRAWGYEEGRAMLDGAAQPAGPIRFELTPVDALRGMVVGPSGEPVAGALIFADFMPPRHSARVHHAVAKTDAEGLFVTANVAPETRVLHAHAVGYTPGRAAFDGTQDVVRIQLEQGGALSGRVTLGGEAPNMAAVALRPVDAPNEPPMQHNCDTTGAYAIENVPPGVYRVSALILRDGRPSSKEAEAVVETGRTTALDFDFDTAFVRLSGRVQKGGVPVAEGQVIVETTTNDGVVTRQRFLGRDGSYTIEDVAPGPARIRVQHVSIGGGNIFFTTTTDIPDQESVAFDIEIP